MRATASLARLLRDSNRRVEARAIFANIYSWFTEGFDTADLKDAKALLDELQIQWLRTKSPASLLGTDGGDDRNEGARDRIVLENTGPEPSQNTEIPQQWSELLGARKKCER